MEMTSLCGDILLLNMEQTLGGRLLVACAMQDEWGRKGKRLRKCALELSFLWQAELADVHFTSPVEAQAQGRVCERHFWVLLVSRSVIFRAARHLKLH